MKQFSIIVPIYNAGPFLDEAIQSVLNQTYIHWELILVNDGSTDNSADICAGYVSLDARIRYFFKANGGQASARNLGIKNAQYELIAFLDADDLWVKNKLEIQINELDQHHPDFLYSAGVEMYPDKNVAYEWHFDKFNGADFFKILYRSCAVNCNTVVVTKKLIEEVGFFDESAGLRGVEDWDLWLRLTLKGKIIFGSEKVLACYRIHGNGIHHQQARMFIGKLHVYEKINKQASIPRLVKLRQYRYVYRELLNFLFEENRLDEMNEYMSKFLREDKFNPSVWKQWVLLKLFSKTNFIWISNKLIYRISYRLEWITYVLFINKKWRV